MTSSTTNVDAPATNRWPTILTIARMICGPVIAGLILWAASITYDDHLLAGFGYALAFALFLAAAGTDWLDGFLARKLNAVTAMGAALDHVADKVLIACALIALAYAALPFDLAAAATLIIGRDMAVAGLREGLSLSGRALPVANLGKWKAAGEMAGVAAFLAFQSAALLQLSANVVLGLFWAARILLWAAAVLALVSAAQYAAAAARRA